MTAFDWSRTPLGDVDAWPPSLCNAVRLLLDCKLPMYLAWGEQFTQFYNDAYVPILGEKDADALGSDARVTWSEIWPTIGPMWQKVLTGEGIGFERFKLTIERFGYPEDCYFSFSYSPVRADDGTPQGVLVTFAETTREVLAEQRQAFQLALTDALRALDDPQAITSQAASMLGEHVSADRVGYGEIDAVSDSVSVRRDWTADSGTMHSLAGETRPLDSFGPNIIAVLKAGQTLRLDDIQADPRSSPYAAGYASIGTKSLLVVPLVKGGRLVAILYLHCANPRRWSDADVFLAEEVAQRTWDAIERANAQNALRLANSRKDEFLAMLAHELRNPLAPIGGAAQLLGLGQVEGGRAIEIGRIISRQVGHMTALLNDLLDVSRVTRGMVELELDAVDMRAVVDTASEQVRPLVEQRRHVLAYTAPAQPIMVHGDFVRLVQVLANVINNAAKYTPPGGRLAVVLREQADRVVIAVSDNGNGIAPELLPDVFDSFIQGRRTLGRAQGGLGLGLALVKSLVELHCGRVNAHSAGEGQGSTITIELPRWQGATVEPAAREGEARHCSKTAPLNILLVDDNADGAMMLAQLIGQLGHVVTVVHDARSALASAAAVAPHVVLLDIGLPDIDGYELIACLKTQPDCANARFIAVTGYGQGQDRQRAFDAGFWRHMTKPACVDTLAGYLAEAAQLPAVSASATREG
ncbi:ATP-binding protein [Pseudoduganella armeniaca]|nr:ATP-binding protein [Pseudoduganella armeniaca]